MKHDIKVGQQVYVVQAQYRREDTLRAAYEEVTRIGNKYFYTGEGWKETKYSLKTLREVSDSNYHAAAYLTKEEFDERIALTDAWNEFKTVASNLYSRPEHLTLQDIQSIVNTLKDF